MRKNQSATEQVWVVYDGECPICQTYCRHLRLRKLVGELRLVDARTPGPLMDEVTAAGLDVDQGMVLKFKETLYCGADAMYMLTLLSTRAGWFNRVNFAIFGKPVGARVFYPIAKVFRRVLLKWLDVRNIENIKPPKF